MADVQSGSEMVQPVQTTTPKLSHTPTKVRETFCAPHVIETADFASHCATLVHICIRSEYAYKITTGHKIFLLFFAEFQ